MGTVIYSASPLWAFLSSAFLPILFTGVFGIVGVAAAVFQRKQGKGARIAMGVCGVLLLTFSGVYAVISYISFSSGAETVAVRLNDKRVEQRSCGDNSTCTHYILETNAANVNYDFDVNAQAYGLAQVDTCYQVQFYPSKSPLAAASDANSYHLVETITRIEVADAAACK